MLPVADALTRVLAGVTPIGRETVPLAKAFGRTLAEDVVARRTQPPCDVSAMDGYALQVADAAAAGATLTVVGESAAGRRFTGHLGPGQAVRIFTGAPVPPGADAILVQEDAAREGTALRVLEPPQAGRHIRRAGLDFRQGEVGLPAGTRLNPAELALAAAMNHPTLPVAAKPLVAILATGDELVAPGQDPGHDSIVASNTYAVAALAEAAGARVHDLGIVGDDVAAQVAAIGRAAAMKADVLVTLGGASVGDHDVIQQSLKEAGMTLAFWKIAMRPGKPMMHGAIGPMRVLGLPGNPVSSIVVGLLFLRPLVRALCGDPAPAADPTEAAVLGVDMPANDMRADYLRGTMTMPAGGGVPVVSAPPKQDSSMLRVLAGAGCLIVRPPFAPATSAGDPCRIIRLDRLPF